MSRTARLVIPHVAHHVVHRSYKREPIFIRDEDYRHYLTNLAESRRLLGCKIYAFCLMLNHVHLLVGPGDNPANLARLMQRVAILQARYLKRSDKRNGPLWEGRFRSSPVAQDFLLPCARYIELNPVRVLLAEHPKQYRWSSAKARVGEERFDIDWDDAYVALGATANERARHYRRYLEAPIPWEEWSTIRQALQSADVTASDGFRADLAANSGTPIERRRRGRPCREPVPIFSC